MSIFQHTQTLTVIPAFRLVQHQHHGLCSPHQTGSGLEVYHIHLWPSWDEGSYGTHNLRKTWGYPARMQGVDLALIMQKLNHASVSQTKRYLGITNNDLKLAHCIDVACTSASVTTLHSAGNVGTYTSVTFGTDGLGLISYFDTTNFALKVAHCSNVFCVRYWRRR